MRDSWLRPEVAGLLPLQHGGGGCGGGSGGGGRWWCGSHYDSSGVDSSSEGRPAVQSGVGGEAREDVVHLPPQQQAGPANKKLKINPR